MPSRFTTLCLALVLPLAATANTDRSGHHRHDMPAQPYAGQQQREIKSLPDAEIAALLKGDGMGYAKAAELNGYPGPAHVIELADALALDDSQRAATRQLMHQHKARARELGAALVEAERQLDRAFAHRHIDERLLSTLTQRVAELQAQLRSEHLATHLAQTRLLTPQQVHRYNEMRGYAAAGGTTE
ncbi:periplasmic heavy metal sensor [Schlegelella sp. S2-27]|uniref:Periplasmic heavy metal sensor n=1 Tax=Caldimonas mangrovi TaxID=2944811 RepID=A0ABT0YRG6_9BURK|nr:periplasmic heavy metal sensor [Caldimonas mangrovi]MCM5680731.1 periplasmic heavy metal sensor [Caldimonas mangrovi]